jgi:hypothetical protein
MSWDGQFCTRGGARTKRWGGPGGAGGRELGLYAAYALYWVFGVDRTFYENLNVNVQYFQRRVRAYQSPDAVADPVARSFAVQSALLAGQRDRTDDGVTVRWSNKWFNDSLEVELFLIRNLSRNDIFVRPLATYTFTDHWKAQRPRVLPRSSRHSMRTPGTQSRGFSRNAV